MQPGDSLKAAQLRCDDDAMDDLDRQLSALIMDREWKYGSPPGST